MRREAVKTLVLIILVVVVGRTASGIGAVGNVRVGEWYLGALVLLATFAAAAFFVLTLAAGIGRQEEPPVLGSAALSRIAQLLLAALATWFLYTGIDGVIRLQWRNTLDIVFAVLVIALLALAVWQVYTGFDEISASLNRLKTARQREGSPSAPASVPDQPDVPVESPPSRSVAERLAQLDSLRGQGLVNEGEYEEKRREILKDV